MTELEWPPLWFVDYGLGLELSDPAEEVGFLFSLAFTKEESCSKQNLASSDLPNFP